MSADMEIAELRRQLKMVLYERDFLQQRLDAIRASKDQLVLLLDTPTIQEHLEAEGDILEVAGRYRLMPHDLHSTR